MQGTHSSGWHATPIHYLPYLLRCGSILSAQQLTLEGLPIRPRRTAIQRKTRLGLADYVHLSLEPNTPLLRDKIGKGYPHALIEFDRATPLSQPGAALLKFNTKRWAHRDDFTPITDSQEMAHLMTAYAAGRFPSLEILVLSRLPISLATALHFASETEATQIQTLAEALPLVLPRVFVSPTYFLPAVPSRHPAEIANYFRACSDAREALPPPDLPFD